MKADGVTANITSGKYATEQSLVLSTAEAEGSIYYTLDGTTPTDEATLYTEAIALKEGSKTTIKAVTVADGKDDSDVLTLYIVIDESYLAKIRRAVRRNASEEVDAELTDIIDECRKDLQMLGVLKAKTEDETDSLILGAVRSFARWKFGLSNEDADKNMVDYMLQRDELRKRKEYTEAE